MPRIVRAPAGTLASSLAGLLALSAGVASCQGHAKGPDDQLPQLTKDGSLAQPKDWETWVMVGSSTGLSYAVPGAAPAAGAAPGMFHNVYIQPWAYRELPRYRSGPRQCVHAVLSIHA